MDMINHLQRWRLEGGLTVTELSILSKVATRTIHRVEAGDGRHREATLRKLHIALQEVENLKGKLPSFFEVFPREE